MATNASQYVPLMTMQKSEEPLPSVPSEHEKGTRRLPSRLFTTWSPNSRRSMTRIWFALLVLVLLINIILTVVLYAKSAEAVGVGSLYRIISTDHCKSMERQIILFHLGINVLSTVVLAASGYFTQFLSSPTRSELDRLHARGKWQLIGIKSIFNVPIGNWQRVCFGILTATALPFHLLFVISHSMFLIDVYC